METTPHIIREKINAIQVGLLRCTHKGEKISVPVKIVIGDNNQLNCVATLDQVPAKKLLYKDVTLIQKDRNNYLYIGGRINHEVRNKTIIFSMDITKASWFIRKSKGSVTWLQEKCVYMPQMHMAS
jgi:hypothetical protein